MEIVAAPFGHGLHRPLPLHQPDPDTPIAETLSALDDLVRAGKVRTSAPSNLTGWQVGDAAWTARSAHTTAFISAQNEYSLWNGESRRIWYPPACSTAWASCRISPLPWGYHRQAPPRQHPAGDAAIARAFRRLLAKAPWETVEALETFAQKRSLSLLDVAFGWLAAKPVVASVIAGASTPEQVRGNAAAVAWKPSAEDLAELDAVTTHPER